MLSSNFLLATIRVVAGGLQTLPYFAAFFRAKLLISFVINVD